MLSRRSFLNSTLGAGLASATSRQSAAQTPAVQPARKRLIIDAQVHVWKAESADWQWVRGLKPQMPEPFTIEKLMPLMDEAGVDRAIIIPPDWPGYRNDYGRIIWTITRRLVMVVALVLAFILSATITVYLLFRSGDTRVPNIVGKPEAEAQKTAEKAGLPIMFLINGRSAQVVRIAERHPQLTLIIDHMGVTADVVKAGKLTDAIDRTLLLAKYPNVSVKLSAAPNYSTESYPFRDFLPHIRRLFDAYGPQRCYWGTDITNGFDRATYRQRITHFTEELPFLSEEDKDWIMGRAIVARLDWSPA